VGGFIFMAALQSLFSFGMEGMVRKAHQVGLERDGRLAIDESWLKTVVEAEQGVNAGFSKLVSIQKEIEAVARLEENVPNLSYEEPAPRRPGQLDLSGKKVMIEANLKKWQKVLDDWPADRAFSYKIRQGGTEGAAEVKLRDQLKQYGSAGFVAIDTIWIENGRMANADSMSLLIVLLMLGWWGVMMVCQGEGLEMDFQRRRHPMWEWLLGHPVHPGAAFMAEMLAPLVANPMYLTAPLFWGFLFGNLHGLPTGLLAMGLIGVPVTVALACAAKALEIGAMLRLSMRSRGAVLGIIGWLGYVSMVTAFLLPQMDRLALGMLRLLSPLAGWGSFTGVRWLLGFDLAGNPLIGLAVVVYGVLSGILVVVAVWFSAWATKKGLAGGFGNAPVAAGKMLEAGVATLGGDPLFRKELLWFKRDRGAVIQVILIPLTLAAYELLQFRMALEHVLEAWHWMCGAAVLFGTYFLFILGPRSLVSEGPALWIAWTWPRGMEELLKAKAKLWSILASGLVFLVLAIAMVLFPQDWWRIGLVGLGWFLFSKSLALKAVTLVNKPGDSGEPEPVPAGRRWAASLGTFSFAIGVLTQQWSLAVVGVVFSWITAAAMWQNFRARLPFLFDPWSERLPRPPTLMHAMVAISIMLEVMSVVVALMVVSGGTEHLQAAQAIGYALTAGVVCLFMSHWLSERGVPGKAVWIWQIRDEVPPPRSLMLLAAAAAGLALAGGAALYLKILGFFPDLSESLTKAHQHLQDHPGERWWFGFSAVLCAPLAEEYLFRGLLYRALDREWGGWRAVLASAGFFAVYHPVTSWLPVACLGAACALLFKHSRSLWPPVVLHTVYNAAVVLWT